MLLRGELYTGEMMILQILKEAQSKAYFTDHAQHKNTLYSYQTHDMGLNHKTLTQ